MHKMQATGVTDIEHIKMEKVPIRVRDIILQHLSAKTNTPKFGFAQIKKHTLKEQP